MPAPERITNVAPVKRARGPKEPIGIVDLIGIWLVWGALAAATLIVIGWIGIDY